MTTDSDYQVGDLSSLLGFSSADSKSALFNRSTPSAFAQKLESRALKEASAPSKAAAKKKKVKKIKTKSKDSPMTIDDVGADTSETTVKTGRSGDDSQIEARDTIEDEDAPVEIRVERKEKDEEEKPSSKDAASLPESKNARKKRKRKENALMAEREAEAFDGEDPGQKKKRKKEEEDSDEEEEKETKKKKFVRDPADDERTVFVGNIAKTTRKNHLVKLFSPCGKILKVRIRGAVSNDPKQSKKVAAITNNIHHKLDSLFAYIVFESVDSVPKAVEKLNGAEFQDRHLRVDLCKQGVSGTCNDKLSIFVGNLPYDVSEESLRKLFNDSCGDVTRVRCVRDKATRMGKGFGYVEFRSAGAVREAVGKSEEITLGGRQLRIKRAALYGKNSGGQTQNKFMGDPAGKRKKMTKRNSDGGRGGGSPFKKGGKGPKNSSKMNWRQCGAGKCLRDSFRETCWGVRTC